MFYKREIRIENEPDKTPRGFALKITDSSTGEVIPLIKCIDLHILPGETIDANVTYIEQTEDGSPVVQNGKFIERQETVHNPALSFSAYETLPPLDKLVYEAITDAAFCVMGDADGVQRFHAEKATGIADKLIQAIKQMEM